VCLSKHLSQLSPGCRQEVAAEVHRELMVYMPGMTLTAACDGDAKKMCNAGGWQCGLPGGRQGVAAQEEIVGCCRQ
jgi:hypothetical protein